MESRDEGKVPGSAGHDQKIDLSIQDGGVDIVVKSDEIDITISDHSGEQPPFVVHTGHESADHDAGKHHHEGEGHHHMHHGGHAPIEFIFVNEREVRVGARELSGLQIKQAAIDSGINIKLDFVLAEECTDKPARIISNTDIVCLHQGMKFSAIRDDDNS